MVLRILFVDDEANILQGTRRATRDMRADWDMHFAGSGHEALELLACEPIDVVVSDMRMPGMDGAELLAAVRAHSPSTARIILSGYAEEEAVFRSTRVAHQFLSKPCDVARLKKTVGEIREARDVVKPGRVRDLIGGVDRLPTLGRVYPRLKAAIDAGEADDRQVADIVQTDLALSAELLRLANSAFFGSHRRANSVTQAVGQLGIDVVSAIVAGYSVYAEGPPTPIDVDGLGRRGIQVATMARRAFPVLYGATNPGAAAVYLAGVLHEVGALVLALVDDVDPVDVRGVLGSGDPVNERLTFGADRYAVGAYLLGLWGFDAEIVRTVAALSGPAGQRSPARPAAWTLALVRHGLDAGALPPTEGGDSAGMTAIGVEVSEFDRSIIELDRRLRTDLPAAYPESGP